MPSGACFDILAIFLNRAREMYPSWVLGNGGNYVIVGNPEFA